MTGTRAYRWLAALPSAGILVGVPFANRVHAYVLGLPFVLVWILGCVLLTSALMAVIAALDGRLEERATGTRAPRDGGPAPPGGA